MSTISSRAVAWWPAHEFIATLTAHAAQLPTAGTPAWCELPDDDPRKLMSLAAAGEHHVLRVEIAQQARAEASKAVAAAADWSAVSREIGNLKSSNRIPRRVS